MESDQTTDDDETFLYAEGRPGLTLGEWARTINSQPAWDVLDRTIIKTLMAADRVIPPLVNAIAFGALLVFSAATDAVANARFQFLRP